MIYFFFFFFFENSLHWSEFNSEKKLQTACYFCQRIMNQINSNSSTSFLPAFNSTCSLSNQMNHYCSLFRELPDLLKVLRQTESQLIPNNSCSIIAPCLSTKKNQPCEECQSIIQITVELPPQKRLNFLHQFCSTSSRTYSQICNAFFAPQANHFLDKILHNSHPTEICAGFCVEGNSTLKRIRKKKIQHSDL